VKPFRAIDAGELENVSLPDEMAVHGYLLIRRLLPADDLSRLLGEIANVVYDAGWLLPGHVPREFIAEGNAACGASDPAYKSVYKRVFSLECFHALAHHPALRRVMHLLVGEQLLIHPKPIARLVFPHCARLVVPAHQDHHAIGGDAESFTAWMPLHDCPPELGPLRILEASHRFGLQQTSAGTGHVCAETARGGDWVGGQINAGDALVFHSLTVHAATPNLSRQLRISMDCRFQNSGRAINPAELVFAGESVEGRSWEATYGGWPSDELKYYWRKLQIEINPSRTELARLAQTAEPEDVKARYGRILSQLDLGI
jgi:hypothetical protein